MYLPTKNVPRWIIFLIDVLLTICSLTVAYLIRFDFIDLNRQVWENEYEVLVFAFPIFIVVRILSFYFSRLHGFLA